MMPNTKFRFMYFTDNGDRLHISRSFDYNDEEFYDNVEFVQRYYGVRCRIFVTED